MNIKRAVKNSSEPIRRIQGDHEISLTSWIKDNPKVFYTCIQNKKVIKEKVGLLKDQEENLCCSQDIGKVLN